MKKRVFLIWPYTKKNKVPQTPLWALSLGTYLKERIPDIEIHILDGQVTAPEAILKKISQLKPDIGGISLSHHYYKNALRFARKAKSVGAKVVFGGVYATALKREILKNRGPYSDDYCVDAIIQRDGEKAFYEYVIGKPLNKINNLVYQTKTGVKENPIQLLDLDSLPILDRSLVNLEKYVKSRRTFREGRIRHLNAYSQKGCWWREKTGGCIFCSHFERPLRLRNARNFAKEINGLISNYGIDSIKIDGEDFLGDIQWLEDFTKAYQPYLYRRYVSRGYVPFLTISTRADKITTRILKILKKINVRSIFVGFESGDPKCLAAIRKGISLATIKKAASLLNKYRVWITGSFILGLPGETPETLRKTLNLIEEISSLDYIHRIHFQTFTPLPGSLAWRMLAERTKTKYKGKDSIDWNEARKDWLKYFCNLIPQDIIEVSEKFKQLARQQTRIRFSLVDEIKF